MCDPSRRIDIDLRETPCQVLSRTRRRSANRLGKQIERNTTYPISVYLEFTGRFGKVHPKVDVIKLFAS